MWLHVEVPVNSLDMLFNVGLLVGGVITKLALVESVASHSPGLLSQVTSLVSVLHIVTLALLRVFRPQVRLDVSRGGELRLAVRTLVNLLRSPPLLVLHPHFLVSSLQVDLGGEEKLHSLGIP